MGHCDVDALPAFVLTVVVGVDAGGVVADVDGALKLKDYTVFSIFLAFWIFPFLFCVQKCELRVTMFIVHVDWNCSFFKTMNEIMKNDNKWKMRRINLVQRFGNVVPNRTSKFHVWIRTKFPNENGIKTNLSDAFDVDILMTAFIQYFHWNTLCQTCESEKEKEKRNLPK